MRYRFEDGCIYEIGEAAHSELGILAEDRFYDGVTDPYPGYLELLKLRYGDRIKLEFGPGRSGKPGAWIKKPWATIGLNPSADPKSDIYWDLDYGIPLPDECIDEMHGNQFLEHISGDCRIDFMNACYNVLKPSGLAVFDVPHWQSPSAAGDPTHKWPPFTEASFQYFCLNKDGEPFVENFSDYGITCRFMLDEPLYVVPVVRIIVKLRKP